MDAVLLGNRIKFFRKKADLTQAKLGEIIDVTPHHVTQIERGLALPSVPVLYDISQILQVPIDCFFIDNDRMYSEYAAVKFEHILDRFSNEKLITHVEIQQSIHGVITDFDTLPQLWNDQEKNKVTKNETDE